MGKDYIAPPDLSAEAGFTVMNPQESVNNFLSNSISAANNSRTNFQSGINQAIAAANSARIAEQNRQNALTLQTQRAAAQAERLRIADDLKFQSQFKSLDNFTKILSDTKDLPPEARRAVLEFYDKGATRYNKDFNILGDTTSPTQPQPQPTGTELTPEDLAIATPPINSTDSGQPIQAGLAADTYIPEPQAPTQQGNSLIDSLVKANELSYAAKQADDRAKIYEGQGVANIVDTKTRVIPEFADKYGRTDEERAYLKSINNQISTTAKGQELWNKGKDAFDANAANLDLARTNTKRLIDVYKKMQARGLTISDSGTSMLRAVQSKGLGSDSSSGVIYDEKIKAETLIPEDVELSRELYGALSSLEPSFISINRQLGNVGTQTENDFTRAFKLIFAPGLTDPDSLIRNAEDGFGFLNAGIVTSGIKYGNEQAAREAMFELNKKNLVLNAAGRAIPGDPFRNQPISTQAPAVQQPSIVQQPVAQIAAPKPSSVVGGSSNFNAAFQEWKPSSGSNTSQKVDVNAFLRNLR